MQWQFPLHNGVETRGKCMQPVAIELPVALEQRVIVIRVFHSHNQGKRNYINCCCSTRGGGGGLIKHREMFFTPSAAS